MNVYNIPATVRRRYFAFKVFGGWGMFGIACVIAIRCYTARVKDADEFRVKESQIRKEVRQESRDDFAYILGVIAEKEKELNVLQKKVDSIKTKL